MNNIDSLRFLVPNDQQEDIGIAKRQVIFGPLGSLVSPGSLVIICEVLPGYENPYWEISNSNRRIVNPVDNQTITNTTGSEIASLIILSSPSAVILIINIPPSEEFEFPDELNGTYTCRAPNRNISSSVILTNSE